MIETILSYIKSIFSNDSLDFELSIKNLKGNRTSYSFYGNVAFWYTCIKSGAYIEFPERFEKFISSEISVQRRNNGVLRVSLSDNPAFESEYSKIIDSIYEYCRENRAYEFDCCSRYQECSDARKCVNPNRELMLKCRYCAKLEKNIVFYGENRNI